MAGVLVPAGPPRRGPVPGSWLRLIASLGDGIGDVLPDDVVRGAGVGRGREAGELKSSGRLLVEVELLEFLLRLTEVLLVPVNGSCPFPLSLLRREESVETVWNEKQKKRSKKHMKKHH